MCDKEEIRFQCPNCQKGMRLPAKYAGKKGKCTCGSVIKVPLKSTHINKITTKCTSRSKTWDKVTSNQKTKRIDLYVEKPARTHCLYCREQLREIHRDGEPIGKQVCAACHVKSLSKICPDCGKGPSVFGQSSPEECEHCHCMWTKPDETLQTKIRAMRKKNADKVEALNAAFKDALPLAPDAPDHGTRAYLEILTDRTNVQYDSARMVCKRLFSGETNILRFDSTEKLYDELLEGNITRYNMSRWVEPKPQSTGTSNSKSKRRELRLETREWERRRQWRPIGSKLATEDDAIKLLYLQKNVYALRCFLIVMIICFIPMAIMAIQRLVGLEHGSSSGSGSNPRLPGLGDALMTPGMVEGTLAFFLYFGLAFAGAAAIGCIVGAPIGYLIDSVREQSIARPADDNWDSETFFWYKS